MSNYKNNNKQPPYIGHLGGQYEWLYKYSIFTYPRILPLTISKIYFKSNNIPFCDISTTNYTNVSISLADLILHLDNTELIFPYSERCDSPKIVPLNK